MNQKTVFITGTDTDVGKTFIGQRLVAELCRRGHRVEPRKPAESGCEMTPSGLAGTDALAYFNACEQRVSLDTLNPYRFVAPLAPPAAAQEEGKQLKLYQLVEACHHDGDALLITEGAGGWLSPIAEDGSNADLAVALQADVVVVAADRLGCLNHTLLTVEAIERRGLTVRAIVLNKIREDLSGKSNGSWLAENTDYPLLVFGLGEAEDSQTIRSLADLIIRKTESAETHS